MKQPPNDSMEDRAREILPCPFCGELPSYRYLQQRNSLRPEGFDTWGLGHSPYQPCPCHPFTGYHYAKLDAVESWNTRAELSRQAAEQIEEQNKQMKVFLEADTKDRPAEQIEAMKQEFYNGTFPDTNKERRYLQSGHVWKLDDDDEYIDIFAMSDGNHNGPECVNCFASYCWHCTPHPPKCMNTSKEQKMSSITNEIDGLDRLLDDERARNRRLTAEVERLKSEVLAHETMLAQFWKLSMHRTFDILNFRDGNVQVVRRGGGKYLKGKDGKVARFSTIQEALEEALTKAYEGTVLEGANENE